MNAHEAPLVLAFDTATSGCTVSLTRGGEDGGRIVASQLFNNSITHSRKLLVAIDGLLKECGIDWEQVAAVAVGLGPGSFTGLRIGLSTAKGLVASTGIPLIGISTLDAVAAAVCMEQRLICAALDARKHEVYTACYRRDNEGRLQKLDKIVSISPEKLIERIKEPVVIVGDGVFSYRQVWEQGLGNMVQFAPAALHVPSAVNIGFLAYEHYLKQDFLDPGEASPLYVRASDAELSLGRKVKV